jgi:hypothetical protein
MLDLLLILGFFFSAGHLLILALAGLFFAGRFTANRMADG